MKRGYNFPDNYSGRGEVPRGKSMTVPNQALSIREIMYKSLRGSLLSEVSHNHLEYGEDEDFLDEMPTEIDLTDLDLAAEQAQEAQKRVDEYHAKRKQELEAQKLADDAKRKQQTPTPPADENLPDPKAE